MCLVGPRDVSRGRYRPSYRDRGGASGTRGGAMMAEFTTNAWIVTRRPAHKSSVRASGAVRPAQVDRGHALVIYYDTNQWHWMRDGAAYQQACDAIMLRECWRDDAGVFRVDSRFVEDRDRLNDLAVDFTPTPPVACRSPSGRWLTSRPECQTQRSSCCGGWTATTVSHLRGKLY